MQIKFLRDSANKGVWFTTLDVRWHTPEAALEMLKKYLLGYYTPAK